MFDLYWGGPERRITGLTVRIIAVNVLALVILMTGMIYLGQYQRNLIEDKLQHFKNEVELMAAALSGQAAGAAQPPGVSKLQQERVQNMLARLSNAAHKTAVIFGRDGQILAYTRPQNLQPGPARSHYTSVEVLKKMAGFVLKFLPDYKTLPVYPGLNSRAIEDHPDALAALQGNISISAWMNEEDKISLSAAAPVYQNEAVSGALLLTRSGDDIERDIAAVWINILRAFALTLALTILLSIYLSGVITAPLRKLANAAEGVRKGKLNYEDIPDFSDRHDEIGELSIALSQMTHALWDRMDSIESFAADVSHELKNPLSSLRSAVESAAIVKKKKDRDKLLDIIKHDVERLDRLISDISRISKLDAQLSREALQKIDLKALLKNILDSHEAPLMRQNGPSSGHVKTAQVDGVKLRLIAKEEENLFVWGMESWLAQVIQNLLTNAVSFSPPGGQVDVVLAKKDERSVRITVEDQGPGIPETRLETVFERFYSERPEHEEYGRHSGLGLSICRQITDALGGRIYAENIKDSTGKTTGARFTVILNAA